MESKGSPLHIDGREDNLDTNITTTSFQSMDHKPNFETTLRNSGTVTDQNDSLSQLYVDQYGTGTNVPSSVDHGCHYNDRTAAQEDPNPTVEHKLLNIEGAEKLNTTNVFVRYLKPPTPPPHGPLIVQEFRDPDPAPPPPLVVREVRPSIEADKQPPPLYIRECPPPKPVILPAKIITKRLPPRLPPPLRQKIIERYPAAPPPRPRDIIIEKWLPYPSPSQRPVIYQRAPPPAQHQLAYRIPKNRVINYHFPRPTRHESRIFNLGVCRADPESYYFRDCVSERQMAAHLQQIGIDHNSIMSPAAYSYGPKKPHPVYEVQRHPPKSFNHHYIQPSYSPPNVQPPYAPSHQFAPQQFNEQQYDPSFGRNGLQPPVQYSFDQNQSSFNDDQYIQPIHTEQQYQPYYEAPSYNKRTEVQHQPMNFSSSWIPQDTLYPEYEHPHTSDYRTCRCPVCGRKRQETASSFPQNTYESAARKDLVSEYPYSLGFYEK